MYIYLDKRRIAFISLSVLSFLFALICTFSTGWSTFKKENFGLFSPDITRNNICGKAVKDDKNCLAWFRGAQACMLLGLLSHIITVVGIVLAFRKNLKFWIAGFGQFLVSFFTVVGLLIYSFQSPYGSGIDGFNLGWTFKLSWIIGLFSLMAAILGITDGTSGEGLSI